MRCVNNAGACNDESNMIIDVSCSSISSSTVITLHLKHTLRTHLNSRCMATVYKINSQLALTNNETRWGAGESGNSCYGSGGCALMWREPDTRQYRPRCEGHRTSKTNKDVSQVSTPKNYMYHACKFTCTSTSTCSSTCTCRL